MSIFEGFESGTQNTSLWDTYQTAGGEAGIQWNYGAWAIRVATDTGESPIVRVSEIPLICEFSAAVEMAKAMVNMKLIQAPRAYPNDFFKAKPECR